jgi:hypothetical protein
MKKGSIIPGEAIISKIYFIREKKVMMDRDLAKLYGVETRVLNQAVKRNIRRFPSDFMFKLTTAEFENWVSQIVIPNSEKMGIRIPPLAFTEQGVAMLSSVLKSDTAIDVNIQIIRIFTQIRQLILSHKDLLLKVEEIEKKVSSQDEKVELLFKYVKKFIQSEEERPRVGYKTSNKAKVF